MRQGTNYANHRTSTCIHTTGYWNRFGEPWNSPDHPPSTPMPLVEMFLKHVVRLKTAAAHCTAAFRRCRRSPSRRFHEALTETPRAQDFFVILVSSIHTS